MGSYGKNHPCKGIAGRKFPAQKGMQYLKGTTPEEH
jgi:hypothetical protein